MNQAWQNPPRCLGEHACIPSKELMDKMLEAWRVVDDYTYGIKCLCGELHLGLQGIHCRGDDPDVIGDPFSITCNSWGHQAIIFDYTKHGWDGEMCDVKGWDGGEKEIKEVQCPHCSGKHFELVASFEPNSGLDELDEDAIKTKGVENLFSWFVLAGVCFNCGMWVKIASVECA